MPAVRRRMERETGIEPATNSLEGCDSTTELLPPSRPLSNRLRTRSTLPSLHATAPCLPAALTVHPAFCVTCDTGQPTRAKVGGEGRTRTFEAARATDLQSAAFDRFATSPTCVCVLDSVLSTLALQTHEPKPLELAKGFEPPTR